MFLVVSVLAFPLWCLAYQKSLQAAGCRLLVPVNSDVRFCSQRSLLISKLGMPSQHERSSNAKLLFIEV
jgi:hypothetical protein